MSRMSGPGPAKDDYRGFKDKVQNDVGQAALAAHGLDGNKPAHANSTKVRIRHSDVERVVPSGSQVEVVQCPFMKLKFGDVVLCRIDKEMQLRRFLRVQMQGKTTFIVVTRQGQLAMQEMIRDNCLVGKVVAVECKGEQRNPYKVEKGWEAFKNSMTEFGTSTPWERFLGFLNFFKAKPKSPPKGG